MVELCHKVLPAEWALRIEVECVQIYHSLAVDVAAMERR